MILEPYWKAAGNILTTLEDNHYLYCRKIDEKFFKEKTLINPDHVYDILNTLIEKNNANAKEIDEKQVFLLFYRKNTLLKELLEKFDKTVKEHHIKNIFFFKVREIGMVFNDAFAAVTLLNVFSSFSSLNFIDFFFIFFKKLSFS